MKRALFFLSAFDTVAFLPLEDLYQVTAPTPCECRFPSPRAPLAAMCDCVH